MRCGVFPGYLIVCQLHAKHLLQSGRGKPTTDRKPCAVGNWRDPCQSAAKLLAPVEMSAALNLHHFLRMHADDIRHPGVPIQKSGATPDEEYFSQIFTTHAKAQMILGTNEWRFNFWDYVDLHLSFPPKCATDTYMWTNADDP